MISPLAFLLTCCLQTLATPGDWPEPRQNPHLTCVQPMPGRMKSAPEVRARFDLGRQWPTIIPVTPPGRETPVEAGREMPVKAGREMPVKAGRETPVKAGRETPVKAGRETPVKAGREMPVGVCIVAGALHCYDTDGTLLWRCHPPGINFSKVAATDDLDGDGKIEVLLQAGRSAEPFGAAVLVALDSGEVLWRYDVEPMSYSWYASTGSFVPGALGQQIVVVMQGYPPDKENGYIALFEFREPGTAPVQKWRYDFHEYTCYPSFLQADLKGDGVDELVVQTHSRMWFLDAATGELKHFAKWDVSPANCRSYGLIEFVDLNADGLEDFLCIANFAQHHEVLLNKQGIMEKAWSHGWPESVTTGKVATAWPEPPYADVDGDGTLEVVVSMFNSEDDGKWLMRVYDALTGELKYRVPELIAVATGDFDGDGAAEVLGNISADPTQTVLDGARLVRFVDGKSEVVWEDDSTTGLKPAHIARERRGTKIAKPEEESAKVALRVTRDGQTWQLTKTDGATVGLEPWTATAVPAPDFSAVPAMLGPAMPELLAADVDADGRNELVLYREPTARVLRLEKGALEAIGEYTSSSLPVFADLDDDGKLEIVLSTVSPNARPVVEAKTPALDGKTLWRTEFPEPERAGLPQPRKAYARTGHFTGKPTPDLYVWAGTPVVRSVVLDGRTGELVWEKGEASAERYYGPSVNLASVYDYDGDGKEDLIFTNPDYYCVASGPMGELLIGPLFPPNIFSQPSQGLYTLPAVLEKAGTVPSRFRSLGTVPAFSSTSAGDRDRHRVSLRGAFAKDDVSPMDVAKDDICPLGVAKDGVSPTVCLVAGHYFQGAMSIEAEPQWYKIPVAGENRCAAEGFLRLPDGQWVMGFGRQNGTFACVNVGDGSVRWELPLEASASDVATCDIDGDGALEFVFGTSHGKLYAVGDGGNEPRVLWTHAFDAAVGSPIVADLDDDGSCEVAVATADGYVNVMAEAGM